MVRAKRVGPRARDLPRPFTTLFGAIVEEATTVDEWRDSAIQLLRHADGSYSVRSSHDDLRGCLQRTQASMTNTRGGRGDPSR